MSDSYHCTYEVDATGTTVTGYKPDGGKSWHFSLGDVHSSGYDTMEDYAKFLDGLGYERRTASLTFPSGATLTTCGDKITGRVEPEEGWDGIKEPQRAPLPNSDAWRYTGKERDDFPEFVVTRETVIDFALPLNKPMPKGGTLHAHPGVGSALLRG